MANNITEEFETYPEECIVFFVNDIADPIVCTRGNLVTEEFLEFDCISAYEIIGDEYIKNGIEQGLWMAIIVPYLSVEFCESEEDYSRIRFDNVKEYRRLTSQEIDEINRIGKLT